MKDWIKKLVLSWLIALFGQRFGKFLAKNKEVSQAVEAGIDAVHPDPEAPVRQMSEKNRKLADKARRVTTINRK